VSRRPEVFVLFLLLLPWSFLSSADKKSEKNNQNKPTFRIPVNVVTVHATVSDKQGNPVIDLKQGDFKIYEDGKPQEINTFAQESYLPCREQATAEITEIPGKTSASPAAPAKPSKPRMISLVIDDLTMGSLENFPRLSKAILDFIQNDVEPLDQIALLSGSGRMQLPFTDDKQMLQEQAAGLLGKLNISAVLRSDCPYMPDLQAFKIAILQDKLELAKAIKKAGLCPDQRYQHPEALRMKAIIQDSEYESRILSLLDTFRRHIRSLKHFEAEKSIVFFSDGFLSEASRFIAYQIQEVVDLALNSGVILNCVNIRGLESGIDISQKAVTLSDQMQENLNDMTAKEAPLEQLAYDTGGQFFHNHNNLYKGIRQIVRSQSHYYVLTYATLSQKPNGFYHQIKVEVSRPGLEVSYRKGFYSPKEEMTFERRKKEDILDALQAPGNLNEIPVSLSYNCYREDSSIYGISFLTNIDIDHLRFLDEDARRKNLINLFLVAYDENDNYIDGLEKTIDFKLLESSYADLRKRGLSSRVELKLPFGRYRIKVVVRESVQGKMGSLSKAIEIP
jgi:VWFA-related protein